jgi:Eukaryotic protein of unknown function (DUF829)
LRQGEDRSIRFEEEYSAIKQTKSSSMAPQQISFHTKPWSKDQVECPRAVVVILGWWGAELRHVEKYAELYHQRNCATVSVVADTLQVMMHLGYPSLDGCVCDAVSVVAKILRDNEKAGKKIPVILHAFSNAGSFLVERLEVLIQEARASGDLKFGCSEDLIFVGERLDGQIFDSSPAYPDIKLGFTSTNGVVFGDSFFVKMIVGFLFLLAGGVSMFFNWIFGLPDVRWTFWNNMREGQLCLRQAYIYSTADTITNVEKLEELIENRRRFSNVTVQKFDDSKHVMHLLKHPLIYEKLVDNFLRDSGRE